MNYITSKYFKIIVKYPPKTIIELK